MTREFHTDKQENIFGFFPKVISKRFSSILKLSGYFLLVSFSSPEIISACINT